MVVQKLKVTFVGKISKLTEGKYAIITPKIYNDKIEKMRGKQVKVNVEDEL